jgi:ribosome maturation factor RimP
MTTKELVSRVTALMEDQAKTHDFELVAVEIAGQPNAPIVRVWVDREGGLDIDAIAGANTWVQAVLDAQSELSDRYSLEVSSPGIERPLVKLADFARFAGQNAKVATIGIVEGRKHFTGRIDGVDGETIVMDVEGQTFRIPHDAVRTARLRVEIDFNKEGVGDGI